MRILISCVLVGVMLVAASGCPDKKAPTAFTGVKAKVGGADSPSSTQNETDAEYSVPGSTSPPDAVGIKDKVARPEEKKGETKAPMKWAGAGAMKGTDKAPSKVTGGTGPGSVGHNPADLKSREGTAPETLVAAAPKRGATAWIAKAPPEPQSGRLTAGSFDDNLFPDAFRQFASKMGQTSSSGGLTGKLFGRRLIVTVRGKDGNPLGNARVRIHGDQGGSAVELVTRSDGRVVFVSSWDNVDGDLTVTVTPPDGSAAVKQAVDRETLRCVVSLPAVAAPLPKNLDLVFLVDTTGSMGDELSYLNSEFKTMASTLAARFPNVNQRYGLVVYRDRGDEYVTRSFPFTSSVDEFRRNLSAQRADGGGDVPEAMEVGLAEAVKLQWRTADTARVMFLVADAPPHAQDIGKAMAAADALRKKGVAIYPLACSGYDAATELVMRSCAMLTGGQFLWLTDDSGVGEAHGEPHIPFYHVERQGRLMVRMVASALSGRRLDPAPEDIIRTVGNPPKTNGQ
jgi:hypothetical protein